MQKFKFISNKSKKFNLIKDNDEIIECNTLSGSHTEFFSNKRVIIEGCFGILDYQENYIKLKLKKGFVCFSGTKFLISSFEDEKIDIKGNFLTIEFCV